MCGIFGYYSINGKSIDTQTFNKSLLTILHRGPEFQQSKFFNNDNIALGHVRLSIIDLSTAANQPMAVGKYQIVYNGEIYNYIEIRQELLAIGYQFITNSDTEVLVNAYDYWGEDCVNHFNGMWSFAILNQEDYSLFCSRDRYGVKPFNYYTDSEKFIFSSEIKPIIAYAPSLKKPNYNSIGLFCREGICGEIEETWFQDIYRLLPAHNLVLKNGKVNIYKYYSYPSETRQISLTEARTKFYELFTDAVKLRMRSDVPVGTTLSGGLDSSSIVAALRTFYDGQHATFTAHFPGFADDEYATAHKTNQVFQLDGNPVEIDFKNGYLDILQKIIYHLESGHLSPAIFPLWKVYEKAKEKVTVVLEGQGADELMAGYITTVSGAFIASKVSKFKLRDAYKAFSALKNNYPVSEILKLYLRTTIPSFARTLSRRFFLKYEGVLTGKLNKFHYSSLPKVSSDSEFKKILQKSHQSTLVNLLHYGDAISMAYSIESRLPFMDYRLVDFVMTLPDDLLIAEGKGKYIQRESLKEILPDFINKDVKKLGFPSPLNDFINEDKDELIVFFNNKKTINRKIFNQNKLLKLLNQKISPTSNSARFIFRLICVELWFRTFID